MSFFIVPIEGAGTSHDPRRPKYIPALGVEWAQVYFGNTSIVWASTTPQQETIVGANSDALVVPPLDNQVALVATQNALEAQSIPAQWITAGMTYRIVLRIIVGMAQLIQRLQGMGVNATVAGNLDKTISQLPVAVRNNLAAAAQSLGIDTSGIDGTTTLREALRQVGQQFAQGQVVALGDL